MNPNTAMANMNPMGGPVAGAPMPMMNNAAANQQAGAAAAARQQQMSDNQRGVLNTYIYEYFIRYGMYDCARALLNSDQQVNVLKDVAHRREGNGVNGVGDDPMDTDSKDDVDPKLPDDLPPPKLPIASDSSFLYEWFCLFWDIYNAQRAKGGNGAVNQYVAHTQDLLRQAHPNMTPQQYQQQMARMQNGSMNMAMKQNNLARAAMAQANKNHMQRDPSQAEGNRDRPNSPAGENAPSPSAKRPRLDSASFNGAQPGMLPNGQAGMPGQGPMTANANVASAHQMLLTHGINPSTLSAQQLNSFINSPPAARQKSIATYAQNLQGKQMTNPAGQPNQGSPMVPQGPDGGPNLNAFYNPGEMGPGGMRPGPGGAQATAGSNHALQDYQMQLMLLEQQNKKRLMMARQEQDNIGQQPGGGPGPNGQPFPDGSPQAMRTGASPNPSDQAKRGTPQMNNSGIPSPVPEGGQSRDSPNPGMNFMGNHVDPNSMQQPFFKNMEGMGAQGQMNGMRPPSSHPGQQFNQQQMMAAARQQQQQQGGPGTPGQWQQGPNGQMVPQNMQQGQQMQGAAQQRSMPPPSAPAAAAAAAANANNRTTASPQQPNAAPPTPNQSTKAAPKKKETKAQKEKRVAAQKKNQQNNANNAANADNATDQETPAPATPMTPANSGPAKNGAAAGNNQVNTTAPATTAGTATTAPQTAPMPSQVQGDPNQANMMTEFSNMDFTGMELANPLQSGDVLNDFDFDSFLHDGDGNNEPFDFNGAFSGMEGGEIGAE